MNIKKLFLELFDSSKPPSSGSGGGDGKRWTPRNKDIPKAFPKAHSYMLGSADLDHHGDDHGEDLVHPYSRLEDAISKHHPDWKIHEGEPQKGKYVTSLPKDYHNEPLNQGSAYGDKFQEHIDNGIDSDKAHYKAGKDLGHHKEVLDAANDIVKKVF